MEISSQSLEYVLIPVKATKLGVAYDPTGDVVQVAFKALGETPGSGDFVTAAWEVWNQDTTPLYYARVLVGPGGAVTLATGTWWPWVKVTDSPEVPVRRLPGPITVT